MPIDFRGFVLALGDTILMKVHEMVCPRAKKEERGHPPSVVDIQNLSDGTVIVRDSSRPSGWRVLEE